MSKAGWVKKMASAARRRQLADGQGARKRKPAPSHRRTSPRHRRAFA